MPPQPGQSPTPVVPSPIAPPRESWANGQTFGIEFECLAVMNMEQVEDHDPIYSLVSDPSIRSVSATDVVAEGLRKFLASLDEIPAEFSEVDEGEGASDSEVDPRDLRSKGFSAWYVMCDSTVVANDDEEKVFLATGKFGHFKTGKADLSEFLSDLTIDEDKRERIVFQTIEIVSPVLPATDEGYAVVRALYLYLNGNSFVVNESASMHVHVANQKYANGDGPQFSVKALQKLLRFWMCAEFQMCQLQPFHRVLDDNAYNRPLASEAEAGLTQRQLYGCVKNKMGIHALVFAYGVKYCGLSVQRLTLEVKNNISNTIEFRTCEATFSTDRAVNWIKLVTSVHKAVQENPSDGWEFLKSYTKDTPVKQVLTDIGLGECVDKLPVYAHAWEDYVKAKVPKRKKATRPPSVEDSSVW